MRLWPSSLHFPATTEVAAQIEMPYVLGLVFDAASAGTAIEAAPIRCGHCGAVLCDASALEPLPGVGVGFRCAFCGAVVAIRDAARVGFDYRMPDGPRGLGSIVVAAIDVSGSMAYGRLEAVRASLLGTIADLEANAPDTAFALVAFSTDVKVFGQDGDVAAETAERQALANESALRAWTASIAVRPSRIGDASAGQKRAIASLVADGRTALGPGLVVAASLAAGGAGRVILLTDGCANHGIGALDRPSTHGRAFYPTLAKRLQADSVIVDVVAVAHEGRLELETLAALPDVTGGELYYVDKSELGGAFQKLNDKQYAAHNAHLKIVVPPGVKLASVSGVSRGVEVRAGQELPLGGVAAGREIFVELTPEPSASLSERIPVQVELRYRDERWGQRVEVRRVWLTPARAPDAVRAGYDPGPATMMEVQKAGEEAMLRAYDGAKKRLFGLRGKLRSAGAGEGIGACVEKVDEELRLIDAELAKEGTEAFADSVNAASFAMSKRRSAFVSSGRRT